MTNTYEVRTSVFNGPLDLLLSLIEERKLLINDISLAVVTDDYISHIQKLGQFPIGDSANFILVASILLLIKSKSLLPALELSEEETGNIAELEMRLKIYKRIKELGHSVISHFGNHQIFPRSYIEPTPVFSPGPTPSRQSLLAGIWSTLIALPKKDSLPRAIVKQVMSLEEMIEKLTTRITSSIKLSFREFVGGGRAEKMHVIVGFLAMLELVKQGIVNAIQSAEHGDIEIETEKISTPKYSG